MAMVRRRTLRAILGGLALVLLLAACGAAAVPKPAAAPAPPAPAQPAAPAPAEPQATCDDLAIRLLERGPDIHGAIVADTLHLGGATAPVTCADPANQSAAGWSIPDDWTAQAQQSQYYLIVIRYPDGNRLYVISLRSDGTACIVNTDDECVAQVSDLPDDFDLGDLPDDVAPTIPAGRAAPPTPPVPAAPPPGGGYTPPVVAPPSAPSAPPTQPSEPVAPGTAPEAAGSPHPRNEAAGVTVTEPLLSWAAAPRATGYDVYWGTAQNLAADAYLGTPIATANTAVSIRMPGATAAVQQLTGETTYYWRVDTKNDAGTTRGAVWSFTTAAAAPALRPPGWPDDPSPRNGETAVSPYGPRLSWSAAPRATSYDLYWGTTRYLAADAALGTPITVSYTPVMIQMPVAPGTSRRSPERWLADYTTYYWRVDAKNDAGTTRGYLWRFSTGRARGRPPTPPTTPPPTTPPPTTTGAVPPEAASNPYPTTGATGVNPVGLVLSTSWSTTGALYEVYLGTTRNLAADDILRAPVERVIPKTEAQTLEGETTYYWRVDTKNDAGTTRGSVWSFTTAAAATDTAPDAAGSPRPRDGATGVGSWQFRPRWSAARATSYDVYFGTTRNPTRVAQDLTSNIAWWYHLLEGTTYYWRVDARNDAGTTRGSVWSFTTATAAETHGTLWIYDASWTEGDEGIQQLKLPIYWRDHDNYGQGTATGILMEASDITATGVNGEGRTRRGDQGSAFTGPYPNHWYHLAHPSYVKSGDDYGFFHGQGTARAYAPGTRPLSSLLFYFVGDNIKEEDETFRVTITPRGRDRWSYSSGPVTTCGRCTATITILDDD